MKFSRQAKDWAQRNSQECGCLADEAPISSDKQRADCANPRRKSVRSRRSLRLSLRSPGTLPVHMLPLDVEPLPDCVGIGARTAPVARPCVTREVESFVAACGCSAFWRDTLLFGGVYHGRKNNHMQFFRSGINLRFQLHLGWPYGTNFQLQLQPGWWRGTIFQLQLQPRWWQQTRPYINIT